MNLKQCLYAGIVSLALSGGANAQSLTTEVTKTARPDEHHKLGLSGLYGPISGFIDGFGRNISDYYTEIYARKNLASVHGRSYGLQTEFNKGSKFYVPATQRAGFITDIDSQDPNNPEDRVYLNMKFLPLTITGDGAKKEMQISWFGSVNLPKDIYAEGWMDHNFGIEPLNLGEVKVGRMISKKIGLEGQVAYNADSNGLVFRFGGRYKFR